MSDRIEFLPWDTDFFGHRIGRVDPEGLRPAELAEVDRAAREAGLECLYLTIEPSEPVVTYELQRYGYRFVDGGITQAITPDEAVDVPETECTIRHGTSDDLPVLEEAISLMAPWSRFAVDPRFGLDAARRMHLAWVERAIADDTNRHQLFVAESEEGVAAFIGITKHPLPKMDVAGTTVPGSGASQNLVAHGRSLFPGETFFAGPAPPRNIKVLRWLRNCGFSPSSVQYTYHRWLDEEASS